MIGRIEPKDLPDSFTIKGESVKYAMMKPYIKRVFGAPISGFMVECAGSDGKQYSAAARIIFEKNSSDPTDWSRGGWDVEFYSTRKAAARVLHTGWRRVFRNEYEDAA